MGKLNSKQRSFLTQQFKDRVNFSRVERRLYGHDIAAIPRLLRPFTGNTTPDAVVQPVTEEELVKLVTWAGEQGVPLTPRGKATSGYGGTLPVRKGIVIDFHRMNRVLNVDTENRTVTVQSGVIWEKLDRELEKHGLTLRLYPTSYPASTVGGWLAQGGAGIGSYEMGWFQDSVISARVVLPDGTPRVLTGKELELVSEAEGITGLISSLTIRVQPLEDLEFKAVACSGANDLQKLAESLIETNLPIWSVVFINPRMAELKNKVPLMEHYGKAVEERLLLPEKYIMTVAFRKRDSRAVTAGLTAILKRCRAELLGDDIAEHEWKNRFKLMIVKRLGPSLVPSEVVIPLSSLGTVMAEIEEKVHHPVVKEGIVIRNGRNGQPEVVVLGFIPSDERKFNYSFVFGLALTIFKIAEKHGGRPYATGLYFTGKAKNILGEEKAKRLVAFKAKTDPGNIVNPGKVIDKSAIGSFLRLAERLEPVIRPLGNSSVCLIGERPTKPVRGIPAEIAWYAYGCSQCGYFFPILFPRLLPMMMPKVMPVMLQRVSERVPMPDYMAEQMPELMPKVMDNLMPHMIKDVVPLVTQPTVDYLQRKS